jgi:NAD(P)-dependent dehydrogenase (short-subunit alcohol dehydrogenase family)
MRSGLSASPRPWCCSPKDYPGIDRLGVALHERFGRLDILVSNAGILGPLSPLGHVEPKVWDDVMAVNVTANWRLICAMDPLLKLSDAGRVVFVSSGSRRAVAYWGPTRHRRPLETLARTYAAETVTTPVRQSVHARTGAPTRPGDAGQDPMTSRPDHVAEKIVELCLPSMQRAMIYAYPGRVAFQPPF